MNQQEIKQSTIINANRHLTETQEALFSIRAIKEAIHNIQFEREGMDEYHVPDQPARISDDTLCGLIQGLEYPVASALAALDEIEKCLYSLKQKEVEA